MMSRRGFRRSGSKCRAIWCKIESGFWARGASVVYSVFGIGHIAEGKDIGMYMMEGTNTRDVHFLAYHSFCRFKGDQMAEHSKKNIAVP